MPVRKALAVAVVFVAVAAPCAAADTAPFGTQALLNSNGSGTLAVFGGIGGTASWSWQTCAPDGTDCAPFTTGGLASYPDGAQEYIDGIPGDVVFVGTASDGATAMSPVWAGDVSVATPPSVSGEVRANSLVTPVAALWSGG